MTVTPLATGTAVSALIFEEHAALLTDRSSEVKQIVSEAILSKPIQALFSALSVGRGDRFSQTVTCGS